MQVAQRKLVYYELVETYIAGKKKANKSFGVSVPLPLPAYELERKNKCHLFLADSSKEMSKAGRRAGPINTAEI